MEHETLPDGDALNGDGLALDRRTVLGLLGAGGVSAATGTARGNPGGGKGGEGPTRKWNQDIDARGDDLFDLRSIEVDHVYMAARKADVIIWKDGEGVFHADSSEGMVESGEDIIEVTQAAVGSLTDDRIGPEGSDDLALEAADGETETGTNLVLGTWEDADYQRFEAVPRAPDLYTLEPTHADLAVDVWEVDPGPGADLRHWTPTGSNNQLWAFQDPDA